MSEAFHIDTTKTALIVIDLQNGIVAMPASPYESEKVIENTVKLLNHCRSKEMPVFLVNVTPSPDGKDGLSPIADAPSVRAGRMEPGWSTLIQELDVQTTDFCITKRQWGAFHGTELDLQLRRRKIDTIVLCGISTNIGVESTARYAYELGYNQIFAEDAMSARSIEEHVNSITKIFPRIGRVKSTEEILGSIM